MQAHARLRDRCCFASVATLAAELSCSERTVQRGLRRLVAEGRWECLGNRLPSGRHVRSYVYRRVVSPNAPTVPSSYQKDSLRSSFWRCRAKEVALMPDNRTESQRFVALYVDTCHQKGRPHMLGLKGRIAQQVKQIITGYGSEDVDRDHLARAIVAFVERNRSNALELAELCVEIAKADMGAPPAELASVRREASAWIKANGWPTGARLVRGTHSATLVYDPLGLEPIPYKDWPYPQPSFDEVAEALARSTAAA